MDHYADDLAAVIETLQLKKAVLVAAVTPVMVQSAKNPNGVPIAIFNGMRAGQLANRAQLYRDIPAGPLFGFNRPGVKVSQGLMDCCTCMRPSTTPRASFAGGAPSTPPDWGELCRAVAEALRPLKPHHGSGPQEPTAAERFLATRSFGWTAEPENGPRRQVLLPLLDLLNHHHHGAPDRGRCDAGGHRPAAGQRRMLRPLRPAHPHDPPRVELEEGGVRLSHLCCHRGHPERVRTLLKLALQTGLRRRGHGLADVQRLAQRGLEALGAANIGLLHQLISAAEAADHPGGAVLAQAARRQAAIIAAVMG